MQHKILVGAVGGATAAVSIFGVGTHLLSRTETTTGLDPHSAVSVGGHRALSATIAAARTESLYHPLPWVGKKVSDVACPTGLKAVAGATVTCAGKESDGETVEIPVSVVKATDHSLTWTFER